jgi:hypothetical protein
MRNYSTMMFEDTMRKMVVRIHKCSSESMFYTCKYFDVSPEAAKPAGPRGARITRKTRNTTIAYRPACSVIKYYCNVKER